MLLAAGQSRRMGRCKQLLPLPDRPAVVRCVETILAAGVAEVVVVIGPQGQAVAQAVAALPVIVVRNETPDSDMAGSVRVGLAALGRSAESIFVCLCDHPLVSPQTLAAMRRHGAERPEAIVIPFHRGRKGHPTLFPRSLLGEIESLPTLREVIGRHREKVSLLGTEDEGTVLDMDTWEDYQRLLGRLHTLPVPVAIPSDGLQTEE
jgi:CTP:molybdopterin cytidylyltransferase MocA